MDRGEPRLISDGDEPDAELLLLTRHLSATATPAEEARLRDWVAAEPARERMVAALRDAWAESARLGSRYDTERAWERVGARLRPPASAPVVPTPAITQLRPSRARRSVRWITAAGLAAAVLLLLGAGLFSRLLFQSRVETVALREVVVPRGEQWRVRLPDGSRVVLAPESRLRYPERFGEHAREVTLAGMGYFDVAHVATKPFVVHAGRAVTQVLGTKFVVRSYEGTERVDVSVAEGLVSVRVENTPPDRALQVAPGQVGVLGAAGPPRLVRTEDPEASLGWVNRRTVIKDLPLSEALDELERHYGRPLAVRDSQLATRRITTEVGAGSLRETLDRIALALSARYVQSGDTLLFVPAP